MKNELTYDIGTFVHIFDNSHQNFGK